MKNTLLSISLALITTLSLSQENNDQKTRKNSFGLEFSQLFKLPNNGMMSGEYIYRRHLNKFKNPLHNSI